MFKKILVAVASSMFALSAFAVDRSDINKSIQLKDGLTVHIFSNGKMGMEDQYGRAVPMSPGHIMETQDGNRITMVGNEVARLNGILNPPSD